MWIGTCKWLSCHPDAMSAPLRPAPQSPPKGPLTRQAVPRHPVQCRERAAWRCDGPAAAERSGRGPTWCVAGAPARTITSSIRGHRHPLGLSVEGGRSGGRATWAAAPSHVGGAGGAWAVGAHAPLPRPPEAPSPGRAVPMHPVQGWMHAARRCGGLMGRERPKITVWGKTYYSVSTNDHEQHSRPQAPIEAICRGGEERGAFDWSCARWAAGGAWAVGDHAPLPRPKTAPSPGRAVSRHPGQGRVRAARRCGDLGVENGPKTRSGAPLRSDASTNDHEPRSRLQVARTRSYRWGEERGAFDWSTTLGNIAHGTQKTADRVGGVGSPPREVPV